LHPYRGLTHPILITPIVGEFKPEKLALVAEALGIAPLKNLQKNPTSNLGRLLNAESNSFTSAGLNPRGK